MAKKQKIKSILSCIYLVLIFLFNWSLYFAYMHAKVKGCFNHYLRKRVILRLFRLILEKTIKIRAPTVYKPAFMIKQEFLKIIKKEF